MMNPQASSATVGDEQIRYLYEGTTLSLSTTIVIAVVLAYLQWPVIEHQVIIAWLAIILVITLGRAVLSWKFFRYARGQSGLETWAGYFQLGVLLAGIGWGSASFFLYPSDSPLHQALLGIVLSGMSAGAVSVLSARWNSVLLFLVPALLPISIRYISVAEPRFIVLGSVILMFLVIMLASARHNQETIMTAIVARITHEANMALLESEQEVRNILDQMLDTFYRTDSEGRLRIVSPSVELLLGYTADELIGTSLADLYIEPEDRKQFLDTLRLNNGRVTDYEAPLRHKDGHEVWVSTNAHYYRDINGDIRGVEGVTRDITLRRQHEQELQLHRQHLEELVDQKTHEIKQQAQIIDQTHDSVIRTDMAGVITSWNKGAERLFGYSADEAIGKNISFVYSPEEQTFLDEQVIRSLQEKGRHEVEVHMQHKMGSDVYAYLSLSLLCDMQGQANGMIGYALDITARKKTEEALRESESRYRSLVENSADGIFVHDVVGRFIDVNRQACENLGYSREEILAMSVPDIEVGADMGKLGKIWPELEEGKVINAEGMHRRKDGSTFPVDVNLSMFIKDEQPLIIASVRDVTRRNKAENRLREMNKELEAFAYSVSHDLRAPLRSINGFCHILVDEYSDSMNEEAQVYLQRIVGASNTMSKLIDDLLLLSRVSRRELKYQPVNLSTLFAECLAKLQKSEPGRQANISIKPDMIVRGDRDLLAIVVENLSSNAWKFSSKQESTEIEVGVRYQGNSETFYVRDHGVGFNMEYSDKLFLPFQRLHASSEFEGTGIGLATVQRIINKHGGRIWAESEEGNGACFYFIL